MNPTPTIAPRRLESAIPSRLEAVDALCRALNAWLLHHGLQAARFAVELVARECLNNAVLHGNQGDPAKTVRFEATYGPRWVSLQIADQGPGFPWRLTRSSPHRPDLATGGRGLLIATRYADRIRFNRRGNQITVWIPRAPRTPTS